MSGSSRYTGASTARRAGITISRATIESTDDSKLLQEADVSLYHDEKHRGMERVQQYGFTSRPLPPTGKKKAEAIVLFGNGTRSSGMILGIDDRRHRKKNIEPGETALYDDQGQTIHITRGGIKLNGGTSKKPLVLEVGSSSITIADGKITIKADAIYLIGDTAVGVDSEEKPVKIKTVNDAPAKRAWTKE